MSESEEDQIENIEDVDKMIDTYVNIKIKEKLNWWNDNKVYFPKIYRVAIKFL